MVIQGINHSTFAVRDVRRSFGFYKEVLGLKPLALWDEGAYLLAGEHWICLSFDAKARTAPLPEYTHSAFTVSPVEFEATSARIQKAGAVIWKDNSSEGASLYFLDPDGHKLEIHASGWRERIAAWKMEPWDGLEFFV